MLDGCSDLDLGLNFSSLQSEFGTRFEAQDLPPGMDSDTIQYAQPTASSSSHGRTNSVEHREQEHPDDLYAAPSFSMLPSYSEELLAHSSRDVSSTLRSRAMRGLSNQNQQPDTTSHLLNLDQLNGHGLNGNGEHSAVSGYGRSAFHRTRSFHGEFQPSYDAEPQSTRQNGDSSMMSWIRKLSDINVELHQHILTIPPLPDPGQDKRPGSKDKSAGSIPNTQELAVDCTLRLSQQYTKTLNDMLSQLRMRQTHRSVEAAAAPVLDQPSQLLILSTYLCLIEAYDKILQHIRTWAEVRLKMGAAASARNHPIRLPNVAIGDFRFLEPSSSQPLVIMCVLKSTIIQIHDLVGGIMRSASAGLPLHGSGSGSCTHVSAASQGQGGPACDGLSGVAKVTLQAILAKEKSTIRLIDETWKLALRCGLI